jgi:hypothetical protein
MDVPRSAAGGLTTLVVSAAIAIGAWRADAAEPPTGWQFSATPYFWIASTRGRVGAGGTVNEIDIAPSDLLESVDVVLMAIVQARHGRWAGRMDVFYVKISDDEDLESTVGAPGTIGVQQEQTMLAPEVALTVLTRPNVRAEAVAGLRYWHLHSLLHARLAGLGGSIASSTDWVDGIVGADAVVTPWGPRWHLLARADLGAGGSDFTWQALVGATWDYADWGTVGLEYRHLDVDYESAQLVNDIAMSGPAISFGFRF